MDRQRIIKGVCVVAMAATLMLPAAAEAVPERFRTPDGQIDRFMKRREQLLQARLAHALRVRKRRFDHAAGVIRKRQDRITAIAERVKAEGGDVTEVDALLQKAEASLAEAKAAERRAAGAFAAVEDAERPKVAFKDARGVAREALAQLKLARSQTRQAAIALVRVARALRGSETSGTVTP